MKTQHIFLSFLFILGIQFMGMAQKPAVPSQVKESLKVWGNCEMCKKRIEKAALSAGAISANWNVETKILSVSYDVKNLSNDKIQSAVAASGHDTRDFFASAEAYNRLPSCCQYERKIATTGSASMNHKSKVDCCGKHDANSMCDDCKNCKGECCPDGKDGSTCSTNCHGEHSSAVAGKSDPASSCCNGKTCIKS